MIKLSSSCARQQNMIRMKNEAEDEIIELIYILECLGYYRDICGTSIEHH